MIYTVKDYLKEFINDYLIIKKCIRYDKKNKCIIIDMRHGSSLYFYWMDNKHQQLDYTHYFGKMDESTFYWEAYHNSYQKDGNKEVIEELKKGYSNNIKSFKEHLIHKFGKIL